MTRPDPVPRPLDHLALRGAPNDAALIVGDRQWTYEQLEESVARTAARLIALGLRPGDRVSTWMGKTWLACVLPLAAARAELVHVPINPLLKHGQAAHILKDSGARVLIGNGPRLATLATDERAEAALLPVEEWEEGDEQCPPSHAGAETLAALLYTSGSTGRPKGVMLGHANLWLGAVSVAHYLGLKRVDRTLCVLPLAFDYGQNQLLSTWAAGGCAVAFDYLLANDVKKAVGRHDVSVLAGVPPLWRQLAALDWSEEGRSLRTLTNSGGHMPEALVRRLRALFPGANLYLMYGLTEAFRSASLDPALVDVHPDSVGTAIPFAELKIVRADGSTADVGEEGELVHAGPLVAQGYWKDSKRTAAKFRADGVHSGDRAVVGADGLLRIRGRDDAMIKVSGNRLSPQEIEELALDSGAVRDAAAFGVDDEDSGQAVALLAVPDGDEAEARLRAWFAAQAPAYMTPKRILWLDRLPIGATGKPDRTAMAEMLR